jgi:hypothetical protein
MQGSRSIPQCMADLQGFGQIIIDALSNLAFSPKTDGMASGSITATVLGPTRTTSPVVLHSLNQERFIYAEELPSFVSTPYISVLCDERSWDMFKSNISAFENNEED